MVSKRPAGAPRRIPEWAWERHLWLKHGRKVPRPLGPALTPVWFWPWHVWRLAIEHVVKPTPTPVPVPTQMFMFDDVNVSLIPKNAQAVAGYVDGHYRTWLKIKAGWPHAKKLMIAVFAQDNGDCLDVEPGDASIVQAPAWVKRQLAGWAKTTHDVSRPVVYTSASQGQKLIDALTKSGLRYGKDYLWWSAHYDPSRGQHLCGPKCGFGLRVTAHATQFTDRALNRSLDESVCSPGFFK